MGVNKETIIISRVPHKKPPFTVAQIKKAIPPHCFNRSLLRSFSYLIWDLSLISLFYSIATSYFHLLPHPFLLIAWTVYWLIQGSVATGVFVIAHECGHHAFSDHQWLDNTLGFLLHSALLVPFFSWKYSHRRHHLNTNSLDHDEAFIPKPKFKLPWHYRYLSNPLVRVVTISLTLTLGWPFYLMFNASGRDYKHFASHFYPYSPIYSDRERLHIYISDAGICGVVFVLFRVAVAKGLAWVLCVYGVPLLIVNGFNVLITYLQHTHLALPHYDSTEWDWLRGVLATTDRDLGVLNKVLHNIADTHIAHHLFSMIPHYHAMEATQAIRPVLGNYYHFDDTPILKALWREAKECLYVEPDEDAESKGIYWYKSKF